MVLMDNCLYDLYCKCLISTTPLLAAPAILTG